MADILVSFAPADRQAVARLIAGLEAAGFSVATSPEQGDSKGGAVGHDASIAGTSAAGKATSGPTQPSPAIAAASAAAYGAGKATLAVWSAGSTSAGPVREAAQAALAAGTLLNILVEGQNRTILPSEFAKAPTFEIDKHSDIVRALAGLGLTAAAVVAGTGQTTGTTTGTTSRPAGGRSAATGDRAGAGRSKSTRIFINYRREDTLPTAQSIYQQLVPKYGDRQVFMDLTGLRAGKRFDEELFAALESCQVFLAVVGPNWLQILRARQAKGEHDFVLDEIATAINRGVIVIPVRVGLEGRLPEIPNPLDLPDDIRELFRYQKHDIILEHAPRDIAALLVEIQQAFSETRDGHGRSRSWVPAAAAALALTLAGGLGTGAYVTGTWPFQPHNSDKTAADKIAADKAIAAKAATDKAAADKVVADKAAADQVAAAKAAANKAAADKAAADKTAADKAAADRIAADKAAADRAAADRAAQEAAAKPPISPACARLPVKTLDTDEFGVATITLDTSCGSFKSLHIGYQNFDFVRPLRKTADGLTAKFDLFAGSADLELSAEGGGKATRAAGGPGELEKIALVWEAPVELDLHMLEFGADYKHPDPLKHVFAGNPRTREDGATGEKGWMPLADTGKGAGAHVQIYAFRPTNESPVDKAIDAYVDFASRGDTPAPPYCGPAGQNVQYSVFHLGADGTADRVDNDFLSRPCGTPLLKRLEKIEGATIRIKRQH